MSEKRKVGVEIIEKLKVLLAEGTQPPEIRKWFRQELGLSRSQGNNLFNKVKAEIQGLPPAFEPVKKISEKGNSLDEVLQKCSVDKKSWDVDDFNVKELSSGEFLWNVYFKKSKEKLDIIEEFKKDLKELSKIEPLKKHEYKENGLLLEISFPDLHWGKLAWEEETRNNYDMKIAASILRKAVDETIQYASKFNISQILLPLGNDFFQADGLNNSTTAGTPQDVDSRHHKMFREGYKLVIEIVERLKDIAPVNILAIPGNHDQACSLYMAEILDCFYHNDDNVNVDTRAILRKYYRWGKNLIGFTHGDKEKINDLSVIMATESPKDWYETKYRTWHLGHIHTKRMFIDEKCGVVIEILPSLSGQDSWHVNKGYTGNVRGMISFLYDKEKGNIAKINHNL